MGIFLRQFSFAVATSDELLSNPPGNALEDGMLAAILGGFLLALVCFEDIRASPAPGVVMTVMPLTCLYLGNDASFSDRQLLFVWGFTLIVNLTCLQHKLAKHQRTGQLTIVVIIALGIALAVMAGYHWQNLGGRYANQLVFSAVAFLIEMMLCTVVWKVVIWNLGIAQRFELGAYDESIKAMIKNVIGPVFYEAIMRIPEAVVENILRRLFPLPGVDLGLQRRGQSLEDIENNFGRHFERRDEPFRAADGPAHDQDREWFMRGQGGVDPGMHRPRQHDEDTESFFDRQFERGN